jgi:hypothetical protein
MTMKMSGSSSKRNNNERSSKYTTTGVDKNRFQRVLLASTALPFLSHEAELPPIFARQLISDRARILLNFHLEYLSYCKKKYGWDMDLYASGGYVRDLLLGRISPDLDLSLGLSKCPPHVTVTDVAQGMDHFCQLRPDLAILSVEVKADQKSGAAERKSVDAVQIFLVLSNGEVVVLDLLPTIGAEVYDPGDRIPRRDPRGSAEQDSLRRDLTIGSMLLLVTKKQSLEANNGGRNNRRLSSLAAALWDRDKRGEDDMAQAARRAASDLQFVLLDYHGGIEDISTRTLRCPVPRNMSLAEVWEQKLLSSDDEDLARSLGLAPDRCDNKKKRPYYITEYWDDATKIRALWWAKMMRDDPFRLLRTLRFATTLGFRLDPTFWTVAVPFALQPGVFDAKVSNSRKIDELRKVATGTGIPGLVQFLGAVLNPPLRGSALRDAFFRAPPLTNVSIIEDSRAQRLAIPLSLSLSVDSRIGVALVVAFLSCETNDNADMETGDERNAPSIIAARLGQTKRLVEAACDGLQTPTSIRRAAVDLLTITRRVLEPVPVLGLHTVFARAVPWPTPLVPVSMEDRAQQFATMVHLWEVLRLDPSSARRRKPAPDPQLVIALLLAASIVVSSSASSSSSSSAPDSALRFWEEATEAVRAIQADLLLLSSSSSSNEGSSQLGSSVAGLPEVPPRLRAQVMAAVHVLTRMRGDAPTIHTSDELRTYLQSDCDGLLTKLTKELCEDERGRNSKKNPLMDTKLRSS